MEWDRPTDPRYCSTVQVQYIYSNGDCLLFDRVNRSLRVLTRHDKSLIRYYQHHNYNKKYSRVYIRLDRNEV